jgi:hypothetical protein
VPRALSRIDTEGIIFFLGVLLSISSLDKSGILKQLAVLLDNNIPSKELIATVIGLASAVIDNVPLVAATMGMYDLTAVPQDSMLWQLIAYCAGTGGSILIIGSAAGVAFMGMESAEFIWYIKRVSPWALTGYLAGIGVYLVQSQLRSTSVSEPVLALLPATTLQATQMAAESVGAFTGSVGTAAQGVWESAGAMLPAIHTSLEGVPVAVLSAVSVASVLVQ